MKRDPMACLKCGEYCGIGDKPFCSEAPVTAPTPERRVGEAEATGSVRFERSGDGVSIIDERGRLAVYVCRDDLAGLATLIAAALSLPTPAPEATE